MEERKLSRRGFIGAAAGTAAGATLGPLAAPASGRSGDRLLPRERLGIQLFTVRDQVASLSFAPDPVANPAGSFSTARRSLTYLAGLGERR